MTQKLDNYTEFDERVDRYLRNRMTSEEENSFMSELKDPNKKTRAQITALMIREMNIVRREKEAAFISGLSDVTIEEFKEISENINLTHFDEEVSKFLKKQMSEAEEADFKVKLKANKFLDSRAKIIAFTTKDMMAITTEEEVRFVEQIAEYGKSKIRKDAGMPSKVISLVTFLKQHIAAACAAGVIVLGGGSVGIVQQNAYNETIAISDRYCAHVPNGLSRFRSDIGKEPVNQLNNVFANVQNGSGLENAIIVLSQAYEKSLDEANELNYLHNDIAWNLSMAYLSMGNRKAAKPILEDIVRNTDPGRPLHDYAQKALNDVNEIFSLW